MIWHQIIEKSTGIFKISKKIVSFGKWSIIKWHVNRQVASPFIIDKSKNQQDV